MNKETFKKLLTENNISYNDDILNKLDIYANFLLEYNSHTNLTAIRNIEDVYLKHFLDSALLLKYYDISGEVLDIGSGAGFPGMVLKIFKPNIKITLLDSNNKKTNFLKELSAKLKIDNVNIICDRAENFIKENREKFDYVTPRAVANLNTLSELCIPFVKVGGYFLPMKANVDEEFDNSKKAIDILGAKHIKTIKYLLPIENSNRAILEIKKIKNTPILYPRLYDKIIKKPL